MIESSGGELSAEGLAESPPVLDLSGEENFTMGNLLISDCVAP